MATTSRRPWRTALTAFAIATSLASLVFGSPTAAGAAVPATYADQAADVAKPQLDIRRVVVRNTADRVTVRIRFPGVRQTYGFPLGYLSVHLDTDRSHRGPEYGHFMQFWSDYRFAPTEGWRETQAPEWGHSPEGRCVADAGVRSDAQHKLRWFEYTVLKREGCFEADAVRVAVSAVNEGTHHPYREYDRAHVDHLGARHSWTGWVPVA